MNNRPVSITQLLIDRNSGLLNSQQDPAVDSRLILSQQEDAVAKDFKISSPAIQEGFIAQEEYISPDVSSNYVYPI